MGVAICWLQFSFFTSLVSLGTGARSFQTSLTSAGDQISDGEYEAAQAELAQAQTAATKVTDSAHGFNMTVLGWIPGINTAVHN